MTYEIDDTDMDNLRFAAVALAQAMAHPSVHALLTGEEREKLGKAARLVDITLQRAGRNDIPANESYDPQCTCGVHRSEHALCGCLDGFQRRQR